jgi:extradiol dioxygenase family protein
MSQIFHLAVPAGDLATTVTFYTEILGCQTGNSEHGSVGSMSTFGAMN